MMKPQTEETEHCNSAHRHPEVLHPGVADGEERVTRTRDFRLELWPRVSTERRT